MNAIDFFLDDVILARADGLEMVVYDFDVEGDWTLYCGELPVASPSEAELDLLSRFSDKLRAFYQQLHNGWYYLPAQSMGLYPLSLCAPLADEEWGILEQLGELSPGAVR